MDDRFKIPAVGFVASVLLSALTFGAVSDEKVVIREGSAITGMSGELRTVKAEDGGDYMRFEGMDVWLFELAEDVNDFRSVLEAGAELQLLPSSALEKIIADFEEHPDSGYRLWGRITKYKGVNYIFADFFLPVVEMGPAEFDEPNEVAEPNEVEAKPADANTVAEPNEPGDPNIAVETSTEPEPNEPKAAEKSVEPDRPTTTTRKIEASKLLTDPNGVLEVPKDVLEKLNEKKILLPRKMEPRVQETPRKFEPRQVVLPEKKIKEPVKPKDEPKSDSSSAKNGPENAVTDVASDDKVEAAKQPEAVERPKLTLDNILADRTARLVKQEGGLPVFVLDALGLGGAEASLQALPCEVLELTELRTAAALDPIRFKIAGIRTKFKGKEYLLLQKATRVYGHGNFGN